MNILFDRKAGANLTITEPVLDEDNIESFTECFKALGDPHRIKILYLLLTRGEMCVCECIPALGLSQSNLSFHLKALKQARFIKARKSGKWMYYSLDRKAFERFVTAFGMVFDLEKWPEKPPCTVCDTTSDTTETDIRSEDI